MKNIEKDRYIATIVLHALGDTIGFRNGKWEFFGFTEFAKTKKINFNLANELLYEFIALGGINSINMKNWYVSDDTLLHIDVIKGFLESKDITKVKQNIINNFIKTKQKYFDNRINVNREPGITTVKQIEHHEKLSYNDEYDPLGGGNGAAMRSPVLGLIFHNDLDALINYSIELAKLTHNNPIGYLGAVTTAYFVYLALNNVHMHEWPYKLIELLEDNKIKKYINKNNNEEKDYNIYVNSWKKYIEMRFDNKEPIARRSSINIVFRTQFYYDNFVDPSYGFIIGASGYLVNIMAYDALLDAEDSWEKLVVYSMLHLGDSDTVGCIAASWYGAVYGFGDVPKNSIEHLEFKQELYNNSEKIYVKYYGYKKSVTLDKNE